MQLTFHFSEIIKSQLATQFTIFQKYTANFREILINERYSIYHIK